MDMRRILTILTLSVGLLTFPGTAMADRDKDRAATRHSYGDHGTGGYRDRLRDANKHVDRKNLHEQYQHKKYQHKKHRAETIKQHKLAGKHQHRIDTYRHFDGNNYKHWRERREYQKYLSYSERRSYRDHNSYRELRKQYYGPNHDRYRTHYSRYHRGHKRSHHQHNDNYLEWVTTMLLLNELLDDGYRYQ
jgi:hypothetical protein